MSASIWSDTLGDFRKKVGGTDPVPAGVSISAVTASLALALIAKVLRIKHAGMDLIEAVERNSTQLAELADKDVRAFELYMECVRNKQPKDDAMREAIRVPMDAARSALDGLKLCREVAPVFSAGLTASDLGVAGSLLHGAAQAMLLSAEANLAHLRPDDPFSVETAAEVTKLRGINSV